MPRSPLPPAVAAQALFASDRMCCVCRTEESARATQIHHIDGNPANNEVENLAVLCLTHHAETRPGRGFTRHLDPATVRLYRDTWMQEVARRRAGSAPGESPPLLDASEFVRDVTVPDGSVFAPGDHFVKTWEIRNSGQVPWIDRRLVRTHIEDGLYLPASPSSVPVPDALPGQTVQVSLPMVAPEAEGAKIVQFKMVRPDGALCFPDRYPIGLAVVIVVRRHASRADS